MYNKLEDVPQAVDGLDSSDDESASLEAPKGPSEEEAALRIQTACRRCLAKLAAFRRLVSASTRQYVREAVSRVEELRQQQAAADAGVAATRIQSAYRGSCARRAYRRRLASRSAAAVRIQCVCKGRWARQRAARLRQERRDGALGLLQRVCRGHLARLELAELRRQRTREEAAVGLQKWRRGQAARAKVLPVLQARREAVARIRGLLFVQRAREELRDLRLERAALVARSVCRIQRCHRGQVGRQLARSRAEARLRSVLLIQGLARGRQAQEQLRKFRELDAVLLLQGFEKVRQARQRLRDFRELDAAVTIQKWRRGKLACARLTNKHSNLHK